MVNNDTGFGLSSSIYTRDVNKAFTAMRDISTGIMYVNAGTIGAEVHLPFGGTRGTGNGHREAGTAALTCTRNGSPSTWTSAGSSRGPRSITSRRRYPRPDSWSTGPDAGNSHSASWLWEFRL